MTHEKSVEIVRAASAEKSVEIVRAAFAEIFGEYANVSQFSGSFIAPLSTTLDV